MPIDRKRINGPDNAVPYQLYTKLNLKTLQQQFEELFIQSDSKSQKRRKDDRKNSELRSICLKTGIVTQAKGSAYIEIDDTKVLVSVFDPREIPNKSDYTFKGEIYCEFKYAPFSCKKRRLHQQDSEEKLCSSIMKQALESAVCCETFPNLQVDVYALVLHNDGSALSAAITAAGVALAEAAIPMYDLITAATIAIQGKTALLDPTYEEELLCSVPIETGDGSSDSHGVIVLTCLHTHDQVSQIYQTGHLSLDDMKQGLKVLEKACSDILPMVKKFLVKLVKTSSIAAAKGDDVIKVDAQG